MNVLDCLAEWCPDVSLHGLDAVERAGVSGLPVFWNHRLRTSLGQAIFEEGDPHHLDLNPLLLEEKDPTLVASTFLHEVAHLIAGIKGGDVHGPRWRAACRRLGIPGEEAKAPRGVAPLIASQRRPPAGKKLVATCNGCGSELYRRRRLVRTKRWICTGCRGEYIPS